MTEWIKASEFNEPAHRCTMCIHRNKCYEIESVEQALRKLYTYCNKNLGLELELSFKTVSCERHEPDYKIIHRGDVK